MQDLSSFIAFMVFVCVMTGTPGPGNMAFMAIGANVGARAAFKSIAGAVMAAFIMDIMIALGLGAVLSQGGIVTTVMKILCMAYMLYLSWRILNMARSNGGDGRPLSFWEGAMIHPLSPKTWAMGIIGFSVYFKPEGSLWDEALILAGGFAVGSMVFHTSWAYAGATVMRFLARAAAFRFLAALWWQLCWAPRRGPCGCEGLIRAAQ